MSTSCKTYFIGKIIAKRKERTLESARILLYERTNINIDSL